MLSELLERADNIVGFKDTVSEIGHTRAIIEAVCHTNTEFRTFSGFDENFMHVLMAGGNGCIAGLSNVFPELAAAWIEAANNSDISRIEMIQKAVDSLMSAYDISPLFVPVFKRMVAKRGIPIKARCRCTALGLGKEQVIAADDLFETGEKLLGTLGIIK
jgi:4-hydroxy-tetrahydrodipicolinate synthase